MSQCAVSVYEFPDSKASPSHDKTYMTIQGAKCHGTPTLKKEFKEATKEETIYENCMSNDNTKHPSI